MSICYFYRMTSDTGFAPCVFEGNYELSELLTLACCKGGQIRKGKNVLTGLRHIIGTRHRADDGSCKDDVYVTGIMGNRVAYCAKINKIFKMTEYFSDEKYANRMDQIYLVCESSGAVELPSDEDNKYAFIDRLKRNEKYPLFHGCESKYSSSEEMEKQHSRDKLGKYVLLSYDFSYYGKDSIAIPDNIREDMPKRQETKCYIDVDCIDDFVHKRRLKRHRNLSR